MPHLLLSALASLRPFLLGWLGVFVAQALVLWMGPPVPDGAMGPALGLDVAAFVARLALTVVFVAALVSRHPVTGTTAFWRTRPMKRGAVLAAVVGAIVAVTIVAPAVAALLTFMGLGLSAAPAAQAAVRIAAEQALFAALAFTLAALTRNLAQAIVLGLGGAAVLAGGVFLARLLPGGHVRFALEWQQTAWTAVWVQFAGALALFVPAAHQYLTLKTRTSYFLVVLLMAGAITTTRNPFIRWLPYEVPRADLSIQMPEVGFDAASIRTGRASQVSPGQSTRIVVTQSALFEPQGPAGAIILRPMSVQSRLRFADTTIDYDARTGVAWVDGSPESRAGAQPWASMAAALGGVKVVAPQDSADERFRVTFLQVPTSTFDARANEQARLLMNITSEAYRYEVFARVPLVVGRSVKADAALYRFEGLSTEPRAVWANIYEMAAPPWYEPRVAAYALVNTKQRQAIIGGERITERFRTSLTGAGTPVLARHQIKFDLDPSRITIDTAWLEDAEFVVLRAHSLGRIIRGLVVDPYTLAEPHGSAVEGTRDKGQGAPEGTRDKGQGTGGKGAAGDRLRRGGVGRSDYEHADGVSLRNGPRFGELTAP